MKKGNMILDGVVILAIIFSLVLTVIILKGSVIDPFNTDVQANNQYSTTVKTISSNASTNYASQFDVVIILVFISSWISSLLLSRDLNTNAVFFAISLIVMGFVLIIGMTLELTYDDIIADAEYTGIELKFPLTHWLMTHIIPTMIVVMISIGVVMYGKP